ncbi:MAG: FG-GAP repeat domain-containing protein, partial [Cytophagales bacterium]
MWQRICSLLVVTSLCVGCANKKKSDKLFELLSPGQTNIDFTNVLTYTESFNVYTYRNFYNGGGVAIGDINNDGLADIYFCGNQVDNKLYLNKGGFKFEDVTDRAGVACSDVWSTGVSFADINGDGWMDIYVCKSGNPEDNNRSNDLFINNRDLTFTERSAEYGLNIKGLSTHAAFFDFDHDNDLDCYLLTNSFRSVGGFDLVKDQRQVKDPDGGNLFFENQKGYFVDVTERVGIYSSKIGFGLGITLGDFNQDSWQDIYISNDFFEKDYLYLNNGKGSFIESLENHFSSISMGSMGADFADINNDGLPDLFVTEMLPNDNQRLKTKATFENWDKQHLAASMGYFNQYPHNVLQLNNGDGSFSEISRLSGVSATDWSWGALMADFDNDGMKDIFVTNGIYKDLLDQDYVNFMANPETINRILTKQGSVIKKLVDMM